MSRDVNDFTRGTQSLKATNLHTSNEVLVTVRPSEIFPVSLVVIVLFNRFLVVIVIFLSLGGSGGTTEEGLASSTRTGERVELGLVRLDVVVPAGHAGEGCSGGSGDRLEDGDIGLGRGVPTGRCQKKGSKILWARLKRIRKLGKWLSAY